MEEGGSLAASPPPWKIEPIREVILHDGRTARLRPLTAPDADLMSRFFADLTEREVHYFFALDDTAARQLALSAATDPAYRLVAVGDLDGTEAILGYMFLQWRGDALPTFGACLRREAQSSGLGGILMGHLLTSAANSGVERARLTVHPDNWRALRLYQRFGFRVVGEFINQHQGIKQYRMEVDLRQLSPVVAKDLTIIPRGGIGVGLAAARIQQCLEQRFQRLPLILDRPTQPDNRVIFVVDLAIPSLVSPPLDAMNSPRATQDTDWVVKLDSDHLLIAGTSPEAVESAAKRFVEQPDLFSLAGSDVSGIQ